MPLPGQINQIKIGVLCSRGSEHCHHQWDATATYLSARSERYQYKIIPLTFDNIDMAIAREEVDFILANPAYYVRMEAQYGITRIVSLKTKSASGLANEFGSVIFTRKSENNINQFTDLRGKSFFAVHKNAFGGWIMACRALKNNGVNPENFRQLVFTGSQDSVINAVKTGHADAGCVRTQIFEELALQGLINMNDFKFITDNNWSINQPFLSSTRLYPEWPLAKLAHVPDYLAKIVASRLLAMPSSHPAAYTARIGGWTVPFNYQPVHICLKELKLQPYEHYGNITLASLYQQFKYWILSIALLITTLITVAFKFGKLNARLISSQRKLSDSESKFKAISQSAHDGIIMINAEGLITYWNKAAELLFDYTNDEILGKTLHNIIVPMDQRNKAIKGLRSFKDSGKGPVLGKTIELHALNKQGRRFPVELSISAVKLGEEWHAIGILRDIEKRKKQEMALKTAKDQAESANKAKSIFLASMSHEIRTPMNAILGFTEIMQSQVDQPSIKHYLENIEASGKALLSLINDILDLSKIEAGKIEIQLQPVKLLNMFNEIVQIFSWKAESKTLSLKFNIDKDLPPVLMLDELRIRQILLNLVGNAVKFTEAGGIEINARQLEISKDQSTIKLLISINDTGIGIEYDHQKLIFDAFRQSPGQNETQYGGTGLGLAITKRLVKIMNGQITIQSKPNIGSTFAIELDDVKISSINTVPITKHALDLSHIQFSEATILVNDSLAVNRELISAYLKEFPFTIIESSNEQETISCINKFIPDCILMDIKISKLNGHGVMHHLKSDAALASIPIIALTTSIIKDSIETLSKAGFNSFLQKPVSKQDLILVLAQHISYLTRNNIKEIDPKKLSVNTRIGKELPQNIRNKLANDLTTQAMPIWNEIQKTFILDSIENLAGEISNISKTYKLQSLECYAETLAIQAGQFDIARLPETLKRLPEIIEYLSNEETMK